MLAVRVQVRQSPIHNCGVFALDDIHKDQVVWVFDHLDQRWPSWAVENWDPRLRQYAKQRGYVNENAELVLCIDEAQFLNFPPPGQEANLRLGGVMDREYMLLAAVDIPAGTELTVPPESDADYKRKMSNT